MEKRYKQQEEGIFMKTVEREIIDDEDKRTVKLLTKCGCGDNEARCLCYLLSHETATAKDIENTMDMRQPEVSVGLGALFNKGLLKHNKIPRKGKGRPTLKYTLERNDAIHKGLKSILMDIVRDTNVYMDDLDELFLKQK
jgi:predicted transcriptional regulator